MAAIRHANIDDAAGIARVHSESWRGTYRGIVPDAFLDAIDLAQWSERHRRHMETPPEGLVSLVAEADAMVVGWASAGPNHEADSSHSGELYAIYLLSQYQWLGLGRQLTAATTRWLMSQGLDSMLVWVLAESWPAQRFYESLGGEYVRERQTDIGGARLPEVSYGWPDIRLLTDAA